MMPFTRTVLLLLILSLAALQPTESNDVKKLQKVIIIADPGVDDAAAILMAIAHPDIEVRSTMSSIST